MRRAVQLSLSLCPIDGKLFVCGTGHLLAVEGDEVRDDPALQRGLPPDEPNKLGRTVIVSVAGRWPEDAWALAEGVNDHVLYHWSRDHWSKATTFDSVREPRVAPWKGGVVVERTVALCCADEGSDEFVFGTKEWLNCSPPFNHTRWCCGRVTDGVNGPTYRAGAGCVRSGSAAEALVDRSEKSRPNGSDLRVTTMVTGPNELAIYGEEALDDPEGDTLDGAPTKSCGSTGYIARFDGERWATTDAPPESCRVKGLGRATDGTEWALSSIQGGDEVWKRARGGAWQRVPLPELARRHSQWERLWVVGEEAWLLAWAGGEDEIRRVLLRTGPVHSALRIPSTDF